MVSETPAARASSHLYIALYLLVECESFIIVWVLLGSLVDSFLDLDDFFVLEEYVFA